MDGLKQSVCVCVVVSLCRSGIAQMDKSLIVLKGKAGREDRASWSSCPGDVSDDNHPH